MKKVVYVFSLLIGLLLTGCEVELPETMGGIYGIVSDMETGEPIRGASVMLSPGNQTSVTGSDGHYEFANLEAGYYKLQVSANGYNTNSRQITVVAGLQASGDMPLSPITEVMNVRLSNNYFEFGTSYSELILSIRNTGNSGDIDWDITGVDASWLTVTPLSGSVAMGKTADVKLTVDRSKLATDEASTTFMVNAAGGSQSVRVNVSKKSTNDDNNGNDGNNDNNDNNDVQDVIGGLYAYYTFEENTKNTVEGGYNATAVNGPTYVEGMNGTKAIKFSAKDNSFISTPEAMIHRGTFTISFWVRNLSDGHIFHIENSDEATCNYTFGLKENNFTIYLNSDSGYGIYGAKTFSHESLDYSAFTMITLTRNKSDEKLKLYINGEFKDLCSGYATGGNCEKFIFGGDLSNRWYATDMIVDNLRIYNNRALSDTEVEQIYKYESQ